MVVVRQPTFFVFSTTIKFTTQFSQDASSFQSDCFDLLGGLSQIPTGVHRISNRSLCVRLHPSRGAKLCAHMRMPLHPCSALQILLTCPTEPFFCCRLTLRPQLAISHQTMARLNGCNYAATHLWAQSIAPLPYHGGFPYDEG